MSAPELSAVPDTTLDDLVRDLERLEEVFAHWDENQQGAVLAYRKTVDELHREAMRRLIRSLKSEPAALAAMKSAMSDEFVYAVCRRFGLIKPSLQERVEEALESVRPMLASHGGGVELVAVVPPNQVDVRFLGACEGCPASMLTFVEGVKKAIVEHCPEIDKVNQVRGLAKVAGDDSSVRFISPFALNRKGGWRSAADLDDIPEGGVLRIELDGTDLILSRNGSVVSCFENACAHLGLPIHENPPVDGILECPHHGFQYDLRSGECLTAPEVQLQSHAVRVVGERVDVRVAP
ncbi:MAG: NifU family protein [Myxococcota bacterium]